jgi:PAS domain S-box-containing protein
MGRQVRKRTPGGKGKERAVATLRDTHARTTAILESIADAFYSLDDQWRFVTVNPAAERAPFGRPARELLGRVIWDVFPKIPGTRIHQHYLDAVAKRSREHYEAQSPLNGRWYEVFMFPREGGLDVYLRDIDDRKKAEEALRASEERFRTLADNAPDGIVRFDRKGRYVYVNQNIVRHVGLPAEAIVGKTTEELGRNAGTVSWESRLGQVFDSGKPLRFDWQNIAGRWFDVQLMPESRGSEVETVLSIARDITERKQVEAALRESEERLKHAQQIAHLGSWELDLVQNRLSWSDEVYRIFGLEPQEFGASYQAFLEAVHPDDRAATDAAYASSLREGRDSYESEHRVVRRGSGEIRVVHERCQHVRDSSGRIVRSIGMVHDITERKQTESRLARLASFPERNPAPIAEIDRDGGVHYLNPAAKQLFPDLLEKGLTHPWFADWGAALSALDRGQEPHMRVLAVGDCFYQQAVTSIPETSRIRIYGSDVTNRLRAEQALKRSRQGLRHLIAGSLAVMGEVTPDGLLQAVAAAALNITGARAVVGGHGYVNGQFRVGGSAHAPGAPDCPPAQGFAIEKGGIYMDLVAGTADTLRHTDAELRAHPEWWGLPQAHVPLRGLLGARISDRQGRTNGMILVTDKKEGDFTEEDESLLRQLAAIASLASQHVEARRGLEEADKNKNEFLAVLSHELRNPLTPIRNSLYVLSRAAPGSEQAKRAQEVIDRQTGQLARLVDDLLDVTRVSRNKIQLQRRQLELNQLVRHTVEDHRSLFDGKGIIVETSFAPERLPICGDEARLAQMVGNLLQNAAKYTPFGGKVRIVTAAAKSRKRAVLRVVDTGVGIEPAILRRLFQPFMQAESTLDRSKGGLGLGLALVKGLVELHGGEVRAQSDGPGRGAEFEAELPLDETPAAEATPRVAVSAGKGRRVLIIEDNTDAADSLREVLELSEHIVEVAYNGVDGLAAARVFEPQVVLCDIGLPGMDGYEVARTFRADPALKGVFLVALSGYALPEDLQQAWKAGFDKHLAKPPSLEKLEELLAGTHA